MDVFGWALFGSALALCIFHTGAAWGAKRALDRLAWGMARSGYEIRKQEPKP